MHYEILLVDDETSVTKALKRTFRHDFPVIHEAHSGQKALKILEKNAIDIVISDYKMPTMNGGELMEEIHRLYPKIIKLMLSGQTDMAGFSQALNNGSISKFLCKPWSNNQLKSTIKQTIKEHEYLQSHDSLTGLPSLRSFLQQIKQLGLTQGNNTGNACIALINLKNFSEFNHTYGISQGNRFLKTLGQRFALMFPERLCTRVRDDLFAVVLPSEINIAKDSQDLLRMVETPVEVDNKSVSVSCVIGITAIEDWKSDLEKSLAESLRQMKQASNKKHPLVFCAPDQYDAWFKNAIFVHELQNAIRFNKLTLHYQPQVDLKKKKILGCEALLRWYHPQKGQIPPEQFIHLIERYDLTHQLTELILDKTLGFMASAPEVFSNIRMSINLYASQLSDKRLSSLIIEKLKAYRIPASQLEIEVTETCVISDFDAARLQLNTLRNLGIKIAIDDFGTGFASYEYLCELPVDVLKIDGRFIQGMQKNLESSTSLNVIIATANILNLELVAECVETEEQAGLLEHLGCDRLQGFWLSKALNNEDFSSFVLIFNSTDIH
ncbi:EAL domain-containing protein [Thalassomonas haliotis]|uniref:EAL domain-containing protein n=1 Tax=Thalassomonas haliotis TaxID=485448 RepID=A0ABY7VA12_9GAMM|nr:EAL domain-containing protein [Thalassomonas haliotis]WDE10222.1 EAL domain-containing protein [Thalassomonas haliotis]